MRSVRVRARSLTMLTAAAIVAACDAGSETVAPLPAADAGPSPGSMDGGPPASTDGGAADGSAADATAPRNPTTCELLYGEQVCWGTLAASTLPGGARDITASDGSPGRHFYCYPKDASRFTDRTLLHLVGTGDNPAATNGLLKRACALGFAGVAPMYENEKDARGACKDDAACYEAMRREIVYGVDLAPAPITVDASNAVMNRVATLLGHLASTETAFPAFASIAARFAGRDLSTFALSGHSQGSGHALLLARDFAAERLVMLGGVTDRIATGTPQNAAPTWIAEWAARSPKTPSARFFTYLHEDDGIADVAQVDANYDAVGVSPETCSFRASAPAYPTACRRVRIPAAGCTPFWAHLSVVLRAFGTAGDACAFPGALSPNTLTWQFLLTAPPP